MTNIQKSMIELRGHARRYVETGREQMGRLEKKLRRIFKGNTHAELARTRRSNVCICAPCGAVLRKMDSHFTFFMPQRPKRRMMTAAAVAL